MSNDNDTGREDSEATDNDKPPSEDGNGDVGSQAEDGTGDVGSQAEDGTGDVDGNGDVDGDGTAEGDGDETESCHFEPLGSGSEALGSGSDVEEPIPVKRRRKKKQTQKKRQKGLVRHRRKAQRGSRGPACEFLWPDVFPRGLGNAKSGEGSAGRHTVQSVLPYINVVSYVFNFVLKCDLCLVCVCMLPEYDL